MNYAMLLHVARDALLLLLFERNNKKNPFISFTFAFDFERNHFFFSSCVKILIWKSWKKNNKKSNRMFFYGRTELHWHWQPSMRMWILRARYFQLNWKKKKRRKKWKVKKRKEKNSIQNRHWLNCQRKSHFFINIVFKVLFIFWLCVSSKLTLLSLILYCKQFFFYFYYCLTSNFIFCKL